MSNTTLYNEIEQAEALRKQGKGYPEIRRILEQKKLLPEQVTAIIKEVDKRELRNVDKQVEKTKAFENMLYGGIVMLFGLAVVIYTELNPTLSRKIHLVAFTVMLLGWAWFRKEQKKYKDLKDD